jgi:hypothetical protein
VSEQSFLPVLLVFLLIVIIVAIAIVAWQAEIKRRDALAAVAANLGLSFCPDHNRELARRYENLRGLNEGQNRYVFDLLAGIYTGHRLTVFDFHYETSSTDSKGHRNTSHHYLHVVLIHLERTLPDLFVAPEGVFSKIAQAFGYDDIDFESHEFSRRFCVRSADKKYAYNFCNALMIDLLLDNPQLRIETRGSVLAAVFDGKMSPTSIESEINLLCDVRGRMPDHLFAAA